jgi:hypothetical protein
MKRIVTILVCAFIVLQPLTTHAWSAKGHQLVAEVAFHFLDDSTREKVKGYLGKLSIEEAATWMDDMRSNDFYNYMKPWHYINIEKGASYTPQANDRNILIILNSAIVELEHKETLKNKTIREDLYILFHLVGDLHQPLHVGYGADRGGNDTYVGFMSKSNSINLHSIWDDVIINTRNISLKDCLARYDNLSREQVDEIQQLQPLQWLNESRALLDDVYDYHDNLVSKEYVDKNTIVIEDQILKAGLRLAAVLKAVFK